ncbi:hypothetical protein [Streptomyces sp. XH2]|uniref:hypothetical protein n=1 Tax=Streptomyces sp. XH2 TaxID=3412483 RepID=UPI003C7ACF21
MSARRAIYEALVEGRRLSELDAVELVDQHHDEVLREARAATKKPTLADHAAAADKLRKSPGRWRLVTTYKSTASARNVCRQVRTGELASYSPAGTFEAKFSPTGSGARMYVRFVGGAA